MGAWGIGIHQNDVSEDLKDTYLNYLKAGKADEEALEETLEDYEDEIEDADDSIDVYISLADVMWKKGRLTKEIKEKALEMIEKERTYGRWDEKALKKRMAVLDKFKEQILSPMPERKKISVHKPYNMGMKEGDVFCFRVPEFTYKHYKRNNIYTGKYIIIYVINMYKKDWQIRGIYDDCASILAGICDAMPKDIDEAIEGLNVKKYYELMESSKRSRPKDMKYIGNTEKKIIEENIINLKSIYHKYSLTNECELDGMLEDLHFN